MKAKLIGEGDIYGTRVVLEDGTNLPNVTRIAFVHEAGSVPTIEAEMVLVAAEVEGRLMFVCVHPETGERAEVQSITFADGSIWSPQ